MKWNEEYKDCLGYIDSYWDKVIHTPSSQPHRHVTKVPHPYIVPNDKKFNTIFYWDSYFIFRGLMGTKRSGIMQSMVDNFIYLLNTLGLIPNSNLAGLTGRSQPPFLSSMLLDVFYTPHAHTTLKSQLVKLLSPAHSYKHKQWLRHAFEAAKKEYFQVWIDLENFYNHRVEGYTLARYGDRDIGYAHSSEIESGWDFTSRYYNRCNEFLPIDLNSYLYKYEHDFAHIASLFDDTKPEVDVWASLARDRKGEINRLMWNENTGFFYDYEYMHKEQSTFLSLAGFVPLWAGIATADQAEQAVKMLSYFECSYGLTITAKKSLAPQLDLSGVPHDYRPALNEVLKPKQWDYPNIWAPVEYLAVIGLLRYGYKEEAHRIMEKSVKAHAAVFRKYGTFLEKLNGETGERPENYHYPNQPGFGWTNGVFYRYIQILEALDANEDIYKTPLPEQPPYDLCILH